MGNGIAAVVLARDEAAHIVACLSTLEWAAERLVVVDARSRDATPVLAEAAGARVVTHDWAGWAAQRDFALETATQPWVFFVDADERVPPNLAAEAQSRVARAARRGEPAGFWVPRKNIIMGRWMRHAGWSPDYQLRLFRRDRGRYDPARPVHELVLLEGEAGHLERLLVHHNYATWRQFWTKQRRYARAEAGRPRRAGRARPGAQLRPPAPARVPASLLDAGGVPVRRSRTGPQRRARRRQPPDVRRAVAPQP